MPATYRRCTLLRPVTTTSAQSGQPGVTLSLEPVVRTRAYRRDVGGAEAVRFGTESSEVSTIFTVRRVGPTLDRINTKWIVRDEQESEYDIQYARESRRSGRWWDVYALRRSS